MAVTLVVGDITAQQVDAIVNAANRSVGIGAGVTGAIFAAGGPGLRAECRTLDGCETGHAKATGGHDLPARYVIHAVGPRWSDHSEEMADDLLDGAYERSLEVAAGLGVRTIAFPCISTGVYGFPRERAARVAMAAIRRHLARRPDRFDEVRIVPFSEPDALPYDGLVGG